MEGSYNLISEVKTVHEFWVLRVRIARIWFLPNMVDETIPNSMEIVLVDETGDRIGAMVPRFVIDKFCGRLKEGAVYFVSTFRVSENCGSYRVSRSVHKLTFTIDTELTMVHEFLFSVNVFSFTPPPLLFGSGYNTDYLADVLGVLTAVGGLETNDFSWARSKSVVVELDSYGFRFCLTLFGPYVDQLYSFLSIGGMNVVVAIMFAKVKSYKGATVLQTTRQSSKVVFNPDIFEASQLRNSIAEKTSPMIIQRFNGNQDDKWVVLYEDFIINTSRTDMNGLRSYQETNSIVVLGTIAEIILDEGWWYTNCSCGKKVVHGESVFYCHVCKHHVVSLMPRYCLNARVLDDSGAATLVIFDSVASSLLGVSCDELVESASIANVSAYVVPQIILNLVGKQFLFKVQVRKDISSATSSYISNMLYRVIDMTDDVDVVDTFKAYKTVKDTVEDDFDTFEDEDAVYEADELLNDYIAFEDAAVRADELLNRSVAQESQGSHVYDMDMLEDDAMDFEIYELLNNYIPQEATMHDFNMYSDEDTAFESQDLFNESIEQYFEDYYPDIESDSMDTTTSEPISEVTDMSDSWEENVTSSMSDDDIE